MEVCTRADEEEDHQEEGLEFEDAEHGGRLALGLLCDLSRGAARCF